MGKLLKAFHRLVLYAYAAFTALAYAFYAVEACVLAFVTLGSGYHLAVSRLKIEYKLNTKPVLVAFTTNLPIYNCFLSNNAA